MSSQGGEAKRMLGFRRCGSYLCDFVHAVTDPSRDRCHYEPISPITLGGSTKCESLYSAIVGHGMLTLEGPMALDMVGSHMQAVSPSAGLDSHSMWVVTEEFVIEAVMMVHLQLSPRRRLSLLV